MAIDWTKTRETSAGTFITPRGKMYWPALFTPTVAKGEESKGKEPQYQITLLLPKAADFGPLVRAVQKVISENLTPEQQKVTKVKKPFIKVEEQPKVVAALEQAGLSAADFPVMIRFNAKQRFKPAVVSADMSPVSDPEQTYSGRWCVVSCRPFWWKHPTGGHGVSFGLSNVQLLENDEMIGVGRISAEKEFEPVESADGAAAMTADDVFN